MLYFGWRVITRMATIPYRIHLVPEQEGGYTVTVPALAGCVTYGENFDHAITMAREAIEGYLEALKKADKPIPQESLTDELEAIIEVSAPV
jgi:predicted RNase H-like HicB family nuclease